MSSSVVVATTSSHLDPDSLNSPEASDDFLTKPRGYFADQFEVRFLDLRSRYEYLYTDS